MKRRLYPVLSLLTMLTGLVLWSGACVSVRVVTGTENDAGRVDEKTGVDSEISTNKRDSVNLK